MVWWIWPLLWMEPARTPPRPEVDRCFARCQLQMQTGQLPYRLHRPSSIGPAERLPLLVWLHGRGEAGDNNRDQLAWLELVLGRHASQTPDRRLLIVALQCPTSQPTWVAVQPGQPDPLQWVECVLKDVLQHESVDPDRIYLAGVCSGAAGCWELARRNPGRFAAVIPLASTSADLRAAAALIDTPVWAFQSTADDRATLQHAANVVVALRRAGGRAHLTQVDSPTHDCWTAAFRQYRVGDWMLSQRRGRTIAWPPGLAPVRRSTVAATAVSIAALGAAVTYRAARKQLRRERISTGRRQAHFSAIAPSPANHAKRAKK